MKDVTVAVNDTGYFYEIIESSCNAEECEGVIVYGIMMSRNGGKVLAVDDVSSVRFMVEKLLEICSINKIMPEHLQDIIEDYLD